MMNIVVCTDNKYVMPTCVMMNSLLINNNETITFHIIIDHSVTEEDKNLLQKIIHDRNSSNTVCYYDADKIMFTHFPSLGNENKKKYITKATYYRLFLPSILPKTLTKVLYLDCDIIIRHSLKRLWNTNIDGKAVGAVLDMSYGIDEFYERLGYSKSLRYFNAGVLLINLDYWRVNGLQESFCAFMKNHGDIIFQHDQDVLNYVLRENKILLPFKYNVQEGFYYNEYSQYVDDYQSIEKELEDAINDPVILHFCINKPWDENCNHPLRNEFFKYIKGTPWERLKKRISMKQRKDYMLRLLGLKKKQYKRLKQ